MQSTTPHREASPFPALAVLRPGADSSVPGEGRAGATATMPGDGVPLAEVVAALSFALDMAEGQATGHAARTTLIGMRIAQMLGITDEQRIALYYALLLKDLGCSSNASRLTTLFGADDRLLKHAHRLTDWTSPRDTTRYALKYSLPGRSRLAKAWHTVMLGIRAHGSARALIKVRSERGVELAQMIGLPRGSADAIKTLDEHWDGRGLPNGQGGSGIPMLGRIACLAQTVEVFHGAFDLATAYEMAHARRGRWFDPVLVDCLDAFRLDSDFWHALRHTDVLLAVREAEPKDHVLLAGDARLDAVAEAFARVVDAKSPSIANHSQNTAAIAVSMGWAMGMADRELRTLKRAALLHDIGTLGVSNTILDKAEPLDAVEAETMRQHTRGTLELLKRVPRFRQFAATAAAHHERLDGTGYHLGLKGEELGPTARVLAVADAAAALAADRPHRPGISPDDVIASLRRDVDAHQFCPVAVDALAGTFTGLACTEPIEAIMAA